MLGKPSLFSSIKLQYIDGSEYNAIVHYPVKPLPVEPFAMQKLEVFQSLWSMTSRPWHGDEMPLETQFSMIDSAGFDGVDIVFGDYPLSELAPLLERYELGSTVTAFPHDTDSLVPAIELALSLSARHLNIIGQIYPFSVEEGAGVVRQWIALCHAANLPVTIETHRDCLTTDMLYTLQLMQQVPEMQLSADLSHYVVGREFGWPISEEVDSQIRSILDQSSAFQGRVASREQIQLQISFPHHKDWYDLFAQWWAYGFSSWRARHDQDAVCNFLCELGPREYAMTDANGNEMSDRWEEALMIKKRVEEIWESC